MALNQDNICVDTNNAQETVTLDADPSATRSIIFVYSDPARTNTLSNANGGGDVFTTLPNTPGIQVNLNPSGPQIRVQAGVRGTYYIRYEQRNVDVSLGIVNFTLTYDTRGPTLEQPDVAIETNNVEGSWVLEEGRHLSGGKYQVSTNGGRTYQDSIASSQVASFNGANRTVSIQANKSTREPGVTWHYRYIVGSTVIASDTFLLIYNTHSSSGVLFQKQGTIRFDTDDEAATATVFGNTKYGTGHQETFIPYVRFFTSHPDPLPDVFGFSAYGTTDAATGISVTLDRTTGNRSEPLVARVPAGIIGSIYVYVITAQFFADGQFQGFYHARFNLIYNTCGSGPVVTTGTETIYRRSATTPSAPSGGTGTANHVPSGWQSNNPGASPTQNVYSATRTVTFHDGSFESATSWGSVRLVANATGTVSVSITGTTSAQNENTDRTFSATVTGSASGSISYTWSISGDAEIKDTSGNGFPNRFGSSVVVTSDSVAAAGGNYTLTCRVSRGGASDSTSVTVPVANVPDISVPTNLRVTAANNDRSNLIAWDEVDGAASYDIYFNTTRSATAPTSNSPADFNTTDESYTHTFSTTAFAPTVYSYWVRARSATDVSAWSARSPVAVYTPVTVTESIFQRNTSAPSAPSGGTSTQNHTPAGWSRTRPTPTRTQGVYRAQRTATFRGSTFQSATVWGSVVLVAAAVPETTTSTDSIYIRSATKPTRPTGGTTDEDNLPTGWSRTQPEPTVSLSVWRSQRTLTLVNDVFSVAGVWSDPTEFSVATQAFDYIYQRNTVTPSAPAGGNNAENHTPSGWAQVKPRGDHKRECLPCKANTNLRGRHILNRL